MVAAKDSMGTKTGGRRKRTPARQGIVAVKLRTVAFWTYLTPAPSTLEPLPVAPHESHSLRSRRFAASDAFRAAMSASARACSLPSTSALSPRASIAVSVALCSASAAAMAARSCAMRATATVVKFCGPTRESCSTTLPSMAPRSVAATSVRRGSTCAGSSMASASPAPSAATLQLRLEIDAAEKFCGPHASGFSIVPLRAREAPARTSKK